MSQPYRTPIDHIRFVLEHQVDVPALNALEPFAAADVDTLVELVGEFGRFCEEVIAPLNRTGDTDGAVLDPASGAVTTSPGWVEAYRAYVDAGWGSVPFSTEFGGGGFPWLLGVAMQEVLASSNMAFSLCPMLTQGGVHMLELHGTEKQQADFLPRLVTGEWTATMNLTEPQAGSDVGAVRTRAVPVDDGTGAYRISGSKIFITYGEQDLTDNIVHLVLARVPDAPEGVKGISCFVVPKVLDDGSPNGVRCIGLEHKMGIHGSPTCTLEFDDAIGWLVGGEANVGMRQMFSMMNNARVSVGVEGLGIAERAYQAAAQYARERVQGGSVIVDHPDVRRMLVHMRSHIEAMRALVYANGWAIDLAAHGATAEDRVRGQELADLYTPMTKAWSTDLGSELARLATQVHGGMGFIAETGVEQFERDIRIAAIYEGTNGIQAMDLVRRKLRARDGAVVREQIAEIRSTAADVGGAVGAALADGADALAEATEWLLEASGTDRRAVLAGATPYLRLFATVLGGWFMARQFAAAPDGDAGADLRATSTYFCTQVIPTAVGLVPSITAGAEVLDAIDGASF